MITLKDIGEDAFKLLASLDEFTATSSTIPTWVYEFKSDVLKAVELLIPEEDLTKPS